MSANAWTETFGGSLRDDVVGWRRHLHAHPEVACNELETAAFLRARLDEIGVPWTADIGGHGVVATLSRGSSERSVGLRADMDALPIREETGLPYASTREGVMHACGHDGHTASLLGAAALLARSDGWEGTVRFIFQPAEEGGIGALAMLKDGLFERFPCERVFAFHNWPGLPVGTLAVRAGPMMAGGTRIRIVLKGQAAHAAMPHQGRDPVLAAGHLIVALQSIVARTVNPLEAAVVSLTTMETGSAYNQIPGEVVLGGTLRALDAGVREAMEARVEQIAHGIARTYGLEADVELRRGVDPTVNAAAEADLAAEAAASAGLPVIRDFAPSMAGEDFGRFLKLRPGALVWIGNGPAQDGQQLHSPTYRFNDDVLPAAASWFAQIARRALKAPPAAPIG